MASKLSLFLAGLKRRKVYHVAVAYVVVGFGVASGAQYIFEMLAFGEWAAQFVAVLVILGFPIALILAWAYEIRPEGPRQPETRPPTYPETEERPEPSFMDPRKSIVVLPFDNMSPDPADAFFSDGLTEEIITDLSLIRSLRVISRSSAMVLKGTQKDVRTIGKELDVEYVLEGSVRKAGDNLRITAQLIDAETDAHLWAEKYDGVLGDIFGFQEEVSRAIVDALQVQLNPEEEARLKEQSFGDVSAYELYLQAKVTLWQMAFESLDQVHDLIDRALEMVGENDLLLSLKGWVHFVLVNNLEGDPAEYEGHLQVAQEFADRALAFNPSSAPGHTLQGYVSVNSGFPAKAIGHFADALRLDPNNPEALLYLAFMSSIGGWEIGGSKRLFGKLEEVDPLGMISKNGMVWHHWLQGDFEAVLGAEEFWREMDVGKMPFRTAHAFFHAATGNIDQAAKVVDAVNEDSPGHLLATLGTFLIQAFRGNREEALAAVTPELETGAWWDDFWPILMADGYSMIGETDQAFRWLDHAVEFGVTNTRYLREIDPFLGDLRTDGRFDVLMAKADRLAQECSKQVNIGDLL